MFATEVNEKTTIELDDALEENCMTVYVKTINGKTISIKCDKQKAAAISDVVERRSSIPGGRMYLVHQGKVMNEKKAIEENNIGAETKIEMSLRLMGGMYESDMKDSSETEEERKKRENWKKRVEHTDENERRISILSKRNNRRNQKIRRKDGNLVKKKKTDEKIDKFLKTITDSVGTQLHGMNSTIVK